MDEKKHIHITLHHKIISRLLKIDMSSSKPLFSLGLLLFCLFVHEATAADPLYHFCFGNQYFLPNGPFEANLNSLLNRLSTKVIPPNGFGLGSSGQGRSRVNALGLCRRDVSKTNCKICINEAVKELGNLCPHNKGAIIWYNNCLLKYSDEYFFGVIDTTNEFYMWNNDVVEDPASFDPKVKELLSNLAYKVTATSKLFATGHVKLGYSKEKTLYGLVQCTRDLDGPKCTKCVNDAITKLPSYSAGKRGGRVVSGSCNVRFELYPIVNS
ncbi:hypothetical protein UlMin_022833 [Ulmus minor]